MLIPLFDLLKNYENNDFEEDIFHVFYCFLNSTKQISKIFESYFIYFYPIFKNKNKCIFFNLFPLINLFIIYGSSFISTNPNYIQMVIIIKYLFLNLKLN